MAMLHIDIGVPLLRFVLGFVFLWSGGIKLGDLRGFAGIAVSYAIVPRALVPAARLAAYMVPLTELLAGGLLIVQELQVPALLFILASLVGYTVLEVSELLRTGGMENCGCYGTAIPVELSWTQVGKNAVLFILAAALLASL